jgi:ABC-type transport system involved in multi-copper enzyme maturation permease subunit
MAPIRYLVEMAENLRAQDSREQRWTKNIRAMRHSFHQQWRMTFTLYDMSFPILTALAPAIGAGWVVGQSGNPVAVSYVFVGAALMAMWTLGVFYTGWALANEHYQGTLDLLMTTRTPVVLVVFGKALAILAWQMPASVISFLVVLAFSGGAEVSEPALLFASGVLATVAVVAFSFIFAPIGYLTGMRNGWFAALMPLGAAVSGFLYPIGLLPTGLEAVAKLIPSSWAMEAVVRSVNGAPMAEVFTDWAVTLLLVFCYLAATVGLFRLAENSARRTGYLARF